VSHKSVYILLKRFECVARTVQAIDRVRGPDNSITIGIEEIEVLVMRKTIITVADSPLDVER
jgi:hypothetical protein